MEMSEEDLGKKMQEALRHKLRSMNLQAADLLLVKSPMLAEAVCRIPMPWLDADRPVSILVVDDVHTDLRALDEKTMKEAGWVREKKSAIVLPFGGA